MDLRPHVGFYAMLLAYRPSIVCEVGALDAMQSLRFKRISRRSRVIAFEANPDNYAAIKADPRVAAAGVEVRHAAVTDTTGPTTFHVVSVPTGQEWARGASSLHARSEIADGLEETPVVVPGTRLDEALAGTIGSIAIWIDVEGAAQQVVQGMRGVADRVIAIHVETEREPLWRGQSTDVSVLTQFAAYGLKLVARAEDDSIVSGHERQHNNLLVRKGASLSLVLRLAALADGGRRWLGRRSRESVTASCGSLRH